MEIDWRRALATAKGMSRNAHMALLTASLMALVVALALVQLMPPAPLPGDAPADAFSATRALQHVAIVARHPRSPGSPGHDAARNYLLDYLRNLGLVPDVQPADGGIENIVARLPGTSHTGAILLIAHYDSAPNSPGAADNASGVAVVLETLRALKAGAPLRNDVIALFSDGEESGLRGVRAFLAGHPWRADVRVALNLDTFTSGPAVMWQTSPGNGRLIAEFARSAPHPVAASWSYDVAHRLPYDTDFTPLSAAGLPGYNFWTAYSYPQAHSELDRPEIVQAGSIQHAGAQALALVRHLGNLGLENFKAPDAVYFTALEPIFVRYPAILAIPLAAGVALLCGAVLRLGLRSKLLTWAELRLALALFLGNLVAAPLLAAQAWQATRTLRPELGQAIATTHIKNDWLYAAGLSALTVALFTAAYGLARWRIRLPNLAAGALAVWAGLAVLSSVLLPGFSYMLAWPLLFSLLAMGWSFLTDSRPKAGRAVSWRRWAALMLAAIPALLLWVPALHLFFLGTALGFLPALIAAVVLLLGALIPQLDLLLEPNGRLLPAAAGILGLALLLAAAFATGP